MFDFDRDGRRWGSKVVQFSHFSVKEFLTSERLLTSDFENVRHYHIPFDIAHTVLVRACLTVLLDENIDKERLATFPLAFYAAHHWVDHAKFDDVEPRIQDTLEQLFNPSKPYLMMWIWIHDMDSDWIRESIDALAEHPSSPKATALYYAALCGFIELTKYLITEHGENVNAKCGRRGSPLHAASYMGHIDTARLLLDHGAKVDLRAYGKTPLCSAYSGGDMEAMRLLLESGAEPDVQYCSFGLVSHHAAHKGRADVVDLLLHHKADVNAREDTDSTPLHVASIDGHLEVVKLLLENGAELDARGETSSTPLHWASKCGHADVAKFLLEQGADVNARDDTEWAPLHWAAEDGFVDVIELLLEHKADVNAQSASHSTPLRFASGNGHLEVVRVLLAHGADVHIRGEQGRTAFQMATSGEYTKVAQLFLEHGAEK